jgi:hypothetical protein
MPLQQVRKMSSAAAKPQAGLNVVTEVGISLAIGMVFGVAWKSWSYGQKAKIEEYYANRG